MTQHEFRIRFRANEHEDEHHGSLIINCNPTDCEIKHHVQSVIARVTREHPRAQFDGILYHSPRERA